MSWIRRKAKRFFHLFDLEDMVVGGNCGCCGASMPDEILLKSWRWGLCQKCIDESAGEE